MVSEELVGTTALGTRVIPGDLQREQAAMRVIERFADDGDSPLDLHDVDHSSHFARGVVVDRGDSRPESWGWSTTAVNRGSQSTAICRFVRGACILASSRADARLPPAPPGSGEYGVLGSSPAWHPRPSR
jgi:hypothetical protein